MTMKKIQSIFLPAMVASVAYLLASGLACAQTVYVTNNGGNIPGGNSVEEISSNGTISAFIPTSPYLSGPTGLVFNTAGDLFVANNASGNIAEFSPSGVFMGNYATGQANPRGLVFDSIGNLYVADQGSGEVTIIPFGSPMGTTGTVVAKGVGAANSLAMYQGVLYITDGGDNSIDKVSGGVATPFITGYGLNSPNGIVFDSAGNMFVVNHAATPSILEFNSSGALVKTLATLNASDFPKTIAMDSTTGDLYVTDYNDGTVTEYNSTTGAVIHIFNAPEDFYGPYGIAIQPSSITVPEPSTYALLIASLGLIFFITRRKLAMVESI